MNSFRFADRRIPLAGLLTMLILLAMSMFFWRERTWLLDVAFQTFLMVKDGTVQVMVYRFGAATVQSLPLLGIKLGAPLAVVSWLYSVSFHLHFLAFFSICAYGFKREDVALGVALLYVAMTYDGFYWQTSELQQGLGFLFVSWAAILRYPLLSKPKSWLLWSLTIIALAFYHPLVFMPFYVMLVWLWFKPSAGVPRPTLAWLGGMMLVVLIVKQIWFQNWYDIQKTAQFTQHFNEYFPRFFSFPAYREFLVNAIKYWWGYSLLFIGISALLTYRRQWFALVFLFSVTGGFLLLTAIGDPDTPHRFYAEVNYYPLLVFVLVPFVLNLQGLRTTSKEGFLIETSQVQPSDSSKRHPGFLLRRIAFPVLVAFLAARLLLIFTHGEFYTQRVNHLRLLTQNAQEAPAQKRIIDPAKLRMDTLLMDWGLPYESLLLSATETEKPVTLLPFNGDQRSARAEALQSDTLFVTPWDEFPHARVNDNPYWEFREAGYEEF